MTEKTSTKWRGLWIGAAAALGLALLLGAVALVGGPVDAVAGFGRAHGFGHGGGHLRDPEAARERAELAVEWALRWVEASEAQRERAQEIVGRAVAPLAELADRHHERHEAFVAALAGPEVDRAALERLRTEELARLEVASGELVDALAELAEVLTPEQRAELVRLAERFHGPRRGRH